jgi:hypothetical protein
MRNSLLSTTAAAGLAAAFALAAAPRDAKANTEVLTPIKITTTGADFSSTPLDIPSFNESLGSLQSVLVFEKLTANYKGAVDLSAFGNNTNSYFGAVTFTTALNIAEHPSALNGTPVITTSGSSFVTVAPNSSATYNSPGNTGALGPNNYKSNLSDWETVGPGTIQALVSSTTSLVTNVQGLTAPPTPTLTFTIDVAYSYKAAPEPASALMLGAALIGLGTVRRRRKRKVNMT